MAIFDLDEFIDNKAAEEEEASKLHHNKFRKNLHSQLRERSNKFSEQISYLGLKSISEIDTFAYADDRNKTGVLCPEPIEFLKEFDDVSNSRSDCIKRFEEKLTTFKTINLNADNLSLADDEKGMWYNSTSKFVNLRPGYEGENEGNHGVVQMGDLAVHGVVVGRTGSGKSVFLNNLVFNLLDEYPPWELDLYLADFKKVELSRYLNEPKAQTPHVKAVAATSEIRYVVTLIEYLVDCMKARQTFFMRLGETKLSDFREKYNVVLPRVVFLVDEFQQLFLEATNREATQISNLLMAIVKLGRATGFHLLFASQEMSGALSGKALANFKIRFALPCESEISSAILGNSAADSISPGQVYVNTGNGSIEQNRLFKVPFINSDKKVSELAEHPFYGPLMGLCKAQLDVKKYVPKTPKFYDEDYREPIDELSKTLESIKALRKKVCDNPRYLDVLTLGKGVVYSTKEKDLETFFIERGKNKNIAVISSRMTDLAYVQKLLTLNFNVSPIEYRHRVFSLDSLVRKTYDFTKEAKNSLEYTDANELASVVQNTYARRNSIITPALQSKSPTDFAMRFFTLYGQRMKGNIVEKDKLDRIHAQIALYSKRWSDRLKEFSDENITDCLESTKTLIAKDKLVYEKFMAAVIRYFEITESRSITEKAALKSNSPTEFVENFFVLYKQQKGSDFDSSRYLAYWRENISENEEDGYIDDFIETARNDQTPIKDDDVFVDFIASVEEYLEMQSNKNLNEDLDIVERAGLKSISVSEFAKNYFELYRCSNELKSISSLIDDNIKRWESVLDNCTEKEACLAKISSEINGEMGVNKDFLEALELYPKNKNSRGEGFPKIIYWLNGVDNLETFPKCLPDIMKNASDYNMFFIIMSNTLDDNFAKLLPCCDYVFAGGNIEKYYDRCGLPFTKKSDDSIVIDFKMKSLNTVRSFKMYRNLEFDESPAPYIDFDNGDIIM